MRMIIIAIICCPFFIQGSPAGADFIQGPGKIFSRFEAGLNSCSIDKFDDDIAGNIYLSIKNGTSGYFSRNQAYHILKDFLKKIEGANFRLNNIKFDKPYPFASGRFSYRYKGVRKISKVYISLKLAGENWKISQITIN